MKNVKDQFIEETKDKEVMCAWIRFCRRYRWPFPRYELKPGFSQKDFEAFLSAIDFEYEPQPVQQLWGNIWYTDSSWSEFEVDGKCGGFEEWQYRKVPDMLEEWEGDLDV